MYYSIAKRNKKKKEMNKIHLFILYVLVREYKIHLFCLFLFVYMYVEELLEKVHASKLSESCSSEYSIGISRDTW